MKASFFEMNVAMSGLFVAKNGLNVTAHNIANSATKGYSRQVAQQRASGPIALYSGKGMVGTGAEIYGIGQIRSFYLDQKYWNKNSTLGEYEVKSQMLRMTETVFNPLSDTGINATFDDFFDSIQDLTTSSHDETYRGNVLQTGQSMATYINSTYENLLKQQSDINSELEATVSVMNSIGVQIANLNDQIRKYEFGGVNANDLRDQRALLVDDLSKYVNLEVKEIDGEFNLQINGDEFIKGSFLQPLEVRKRDEKANPDDFEGLYDIYWSFGNTKFNLYSPTLTGELKALADIRDGNNGDNFSGEVTDITNTGNGYTITLSNYTRTDILQNGKITIPDPVNGIKREFTYDSFTVSPDGSTITLSLKGDEMAEYESKFKTAIASGLTASSADMSDYKGIPYYLQRLNDMVRTFAKAVNEGVDHKNDPIPGVTGHINGFDLHGENNGYALFTYKDNNGQEVLSGVGMEYNNMTAGNFTVSNFLKQNPEYLATSSQGESGESNNEVALSFIKIKNCDSLFREGSISAYSTAVSTELGIDLKQADKFATSYTDLVTSVDNQRLSVMSVDIDEEGMSLVRYEQLYQASAKLISVIDRLYDTLINGLGV